MKLQTAKYTAARIRKNGTLRYGAFHWSRASCSAAPGTDHG